MILVYSEKYMKQMYSVGILLSVSNIKTGNTYRGWTIWWKHYRYCTHFCINMVWGHILPSIQR
jgi:hypothetical protein